MTDPNYTALLLVIDRSGSMQSIRTDMIGGIQSLLAEQAEQPDMLTVDIATFDNELEWQCHFAEPASVEVRLEPRGGTALRDAVGTSVSAFGTALADLPEHARPGTVQVVIITDGMENASHEWTADSVKALVQQQTDVYGWNFVFLGANQDAVLAAAGLGVQADAALTYIPVPDAVADTAASLSAYTSRLRAGRATGFTEDERSRSRRDGR